MSNADQVAYMSSDQARMDGVKLLAQLLGVPQMELGRRAFDLILYEHRDLLLANVEEHYADRGESLRVLLSRSLKEIRDGARAMLAEAS